MNILIVTTELERNDERYMDNKGWSFKKAFEKLGMNVEMFFYKKKGKLAIIEKKKYVRDMWRHYMNRQLFHYVKTNSPDIILVITGNTIEPETLWKIRKQTHALLINVFTDNPFIFMNRFESIEAYHYFFVKDTYILSTLKKAGLQNIYYLPQCTNPEVYRQLTITGREESLYRSDIALIGSMYPYRLKLISQLIDFHPAIWGRGWSKSSIPEMSELYRGRDIRGNDKAMAISGAAISLNPHHPLNDINGTGSRTFDIAACKGFQLADYKSDMENLFNLNEDIICFRTMEELRRLIQYYLDHPDERTEVAESGYRRVIRDHTYDNRAKEILEMVSVKQ